MFRVMIRERHNFDRQNTAESGISEDITETYQLLNDLIHDNDTEAELCKEKKYESTAPEARLIDVGEQLRNAAPWRNHKETGDQKREINKVRKLMRNDFDDE